MATCPFPGMDPWLEGSPFWQGFHNSFLTYLRDDLRERLPEGYRLSLEVRVYLESDYLPTRLTERVPDVEVYSERGRGGAAVLERPHIEEGVLLGGPLVERREAWVAVRSLPNDELVTSIELLSPSNKRGDEREAYLRKQRQLTQGGVNLVEIDLLRGGSPTVHVPPEWLSDVPRHDYLAAVFRAAWPGYTQVLPWTLRDPLPSVPVPLLPDAPEPKIDLQGVFVRTYDQGDMAHFLRLREPLRPPLRPEDAAWADTLLRAAGLSDPVVGQECLQ
jgi:hypothetical protein